MIRVSSTASANLAGSLLKPGASRSITAGVNSKRHAEQHDLARQQQRENPVAEHPHGVAAARDADARIGRNEGRVERALGEDRAEMVRQPQRHEKRIRHRPRPQHRGEHDVAQEAGHARQERNSTNCQDAVDHANGLARAFTLRPLNRFAPRRASLAIAKGFWNSRRMTKIVPVILAGGAGTRLWPVSRDALPKQFLPLVGERSTYQDTLLRVAEGDLFAPPIVITGADFRFFARRQAEDIGIDATVVIEPMRRDSGPAVAAAAALAKSRDPDAVVLALAADHVILDVEEFRATCLAGLKAAEAGHIVTFGITPSAPKTSYGYIRRGKPIGSDQVYAVEAFVEKPNAETAARYVAEGYLWNSGNFLFRADVLLAELTRFEPAMVAAVEKAVAERQQRSRLCAARAGCFCRARRRSRSTMR